MDAETIAKGRRRLPLWHEDRRCERCGQLFRPLRQDVARGGGKFCSRKCAAQSARRIRWKKNAKSVRERFDELVIRRRDDECWEWSGFKFRGYGRMGNVWGRGSMGAHRVSYILHVGEIPDGLTVLHECDNPQCTNPKHLRLGTNADNNLDRDQKGRMAFGERNGKSKLTADQARIIKRRIASGERLYSIARDFRVTEGCVAQIRRGKTWAHINVD